MGRVRAGLLLAAALVAAAGVLLLIRAGAPAPEAAAGGGAPPHVVLIIIDTLRSDRLSSYGYPLDTSPEIDALAGRGVRFARTVSQSSWTRPSIGSMLTSIHPRTLGIHEEAVGMLDDRFTTLAEAFREGGYRTLGATANPHLNPSFNFHQGFDLYRDSIAVFQWMDATNEQVPSAHPELPSARDQFEAMLAAVDRPADRSVDRSADRGSGAEAGAPHYLQLTLMEVHETWGENDLVRPEWKELFAEVPDARERHYLQAIRQVSSDIDAFVRALHARPGWEDLLLAIVSDHGEGLGSHPDVTGADYHGLVLYESQVIVPWILVSTSGRVPAGLVVERPVRLLDLAPTLLDLAGLPVPGAMEGVSLAPLLRGEEVDLPEGFVVETQYRAADKLGLYTRDWKLFHNRDGHPGLRRLELHRAGVTENGRRTDVGDAHPDVVALLAGRLERWEREHPPAPPTLSAEPLPEEVVDQLRSLGYLDEEGGP